MLSGKTELGTTPSLFLRTLAGEKTERPPIWLMRQAGRYLPEYRALRAKAGSFLDLCYNPDLATEVTLQPIRRFGFDAAILFSDILVIPHALGQEVTFAEGEGPRLPPLMISPDLAELSPEVDLERLQPVFQAIRQIKRALPQNVPLIGFCGAPWTVASYMIAGKGTPDQAPIRVLAYRDPVFLKALIDRLVEASISYLRQQILAGVDTIQIFESFAGALPPHLFEAWSVEPVRRIIAGIRATHPDIPIVVFARGAGAQTMLLADGMVQAIGLDWMSDPKAMDRLLPAGIPVQGNLDPLALIAGGEALEQRCTAILDAFINRPHIFNLGHGILPETPIAHVERLVSLIREGR